MWGPPMNDQYAEELYLPGELVPPGTYLRVGNGSPIRLERDDYLPASLDGRVAVYVRVGPWRECMQSTRGGEARRASEN